MRKIIRRALSVLTSMCLTTGAAAAAAAPSFTDVPEDNWAYPYVSEAAEKGWVSGIGGGLFAPDNEVTYAELSAMLVRAFFPEELSEHEVSEDVPWYTAACASAEALDLYVGVNIRTQHTNATMVTQPVSRYEMAQILYNTLRAAEVQLTPDLAAAQATTADWENVPGRYQAAVAAVKAAGIITGVDEAGTFNGTATMSRAQAATVMCRMDDVLVNGLNVPPAANENEGVASSENADSSSASENQNYEQPVVPNEPLADDPIIEG